MSVDRPLPARPSLAFDRKEAKRLLRRLKSGDLDGIVRARAQHPAFDATAPSRATLAIAQLVIAREYGFASWPRLVQYYADVQRQSDSYPSLHSLDYYEASARSLIVQHSQRGLHAGRLFAAYVPRFYGMRVQEVFDHRVTEEDARLAIARSNSCPSWEVLRERAMAEARERANEREFGLDPWRRAYEAISAADLGELQRVIESHPRFLTPSAHDFAIGRTLIHAMYTEEQRLGRDAMRPIVQWLGTQGQDLNSSLNRLWSWKGPRTPADVKALIDRGADPNWIAPSGIPLLEFMLLRWRYAGCADLLATYVNPRDALWISAGLGDVNGVRRHLDKHGKPTAAARALRPPLDAMHGFSLPVLPDPDDDEILLEAFWVALLNTRIAVMEYMISRGFDVNCRAWGTPVVNIAVGNGWTAVVECLVRAGADLNIHSGDSNGTARDTARTMCENGSHGPSYRRIVELCGLDVDAIIAAREAQEPITPTFIRSAKIALDLADDDAQRQGRSDVRPENLLYGLLRTSGSPVALFTSDRKMNKARFFRDSAPRVNVGDALPNRVALPLHPDLHDMIQSVIARATARRSETINVFHLLHALSNDDDGFVAGLLAQYGSSITRFRTELERYLS